jgi:uncharacterized protein (DUF1330 family)
MSAIKPNMEQFAALAAAAKTNSGTVVMLNLLKFRAGEGAREYGAYGDSASKMVKALGGRLIYVGRCDQVLIGDDANDWDAIAVVEYPNRQAFIDMVSKPDYQKASEHRDAGLERTVLIATTRAAALEDAPR